MDTRISAIRAALPITFPVMTGYVFLGIAYGMLMSASGFTPWVSCLMSLVVFSGAIQFIAVAMLAAPFDPIGTFAVSLLVGARHIFYGISMLDRYRAVGLRKLLLMHTLTDETFSVNISTDPPPDVDETSFFLSVSLLDYSYWCAGTAIGAFAGSALEIDVKGIDFALTALFVVIFTEQWLKESDHAPSLLGVAATAISLAVFGKSAFIVVSMAIIIAVLVAARSKFERART